MHTCEILVRGYGLDPGDLCGKPATKSVLPKPGTAAALERPPHKQVIWLCDGHYEHASRNWTSHEF